jgi:hypothetical protein
MIEVGFAITLGFAIASTLCGLMEDGSRGDRILMRALVYLIALSSLIGLLNGGTTGFLRTMRNLTVGSALDHTIWLLFGGVLAITFQIFVEGHLHELWIKLHPQSAPTPEAKRGQRAQIAGFKKAAVPASLVGTSTQFLSADLDLREETLIRLSYSTFENRNPLMMSRLEGALRLGTGRRQKAFHKIVAGHRGRPKTKRIAHRYWRSVNGSSRLSQALFTDLCKLARDTDNRDRATIDRLIQVGTDLGLTAEDMGRALIGRL